MASDGGSHRLFLNAAVTSELQPSRSFLSLKLLSVSEALPSFFFCPSMALSSSDAFRCLDFFFLSVSIHLRLTLDYILHPEVPKESSLKLFLFLLPVFYLANPFVGDVLLFFFFLFFTVWFSLLVDVIEVEYYLSL